MIGADAAKLGGCILVLLCASGCASQIARQKVVQTAGFDHNCPPEQVTITNKAKGIWAYDLDVCGKQRKYRDFGNEEEFQFVDVTDGPPGKLPDR